MVETSACGRSNRPIKSWQGPGPTGPTGPTGSAVLEYRRQEPALSRLLQGTFGQVFRSDHIRNVARKVVKFTDDTTMMGPTTDGKSTI
ncbi:hypothetical protein AMECASPLE_036751 [Ameca splendens]|uniref:Uncharacterized protein n=1 Tax=Ameca splendens TaxID=208324 RepID=A0ABV0ZGG5_9TELE